MRRVRMRGRGETISMLLASRAYTYTYNAIQQQPDPKVPPAMTGPAHPICAYPSWAPTRRSHLPPAASPSVAWHGIPVRARRIAGQAFNDGLPRVRSRVLRSPTAQRRRRLTYDKSNGNGVAQPKSVRSSSMCGRFHIGLVVMRCTRAAVGISGSPSTSDVHAVDKERHKSITTRATRRARSAGTQKVGR
jgi:hypothetical protein